MDNDDGAFAEAVARQLAGPAFAEAELRDLAYEARADEAYSRSVGDGAKYMERGVA